MPVDFKDPFWSNIGSDPQSQLMAMSAFDQPGDEQAASGFGPGTPQYDKYRDMIDTGERLAKEGGLLGAQAPGMFGSATDAFKFAAIAAVTAGFASGAFTAGTAGGGATAGATQASGEFGSVVAGGNGALPVGATQAAGEFGAAAAAGGPAGGAAAASGGGTGGSSSLLNGGFGTAAGAGGGPAAGSIAANSGGNIAAASSGFFTKVGTFLKDNKDIIGSVLSGIGEATAAADAQKEILQERQRLTAANYHGTNPASGYRELMPDTQTQTPEQRFGRRDQGGFTLQLDPATHRMKRVPVSPANQARV